MRTRALALIVLACVESLDARVTKIVIEKKETVDKSFGKARQYEILSGHFTGELDPKDPHNQIINDIQL